MEIRRSPRFTNSSSAPPILRKTKKQNNAAAKDVLALSLHVEVQEPVPLKICDSSQDRRPCRRSPRFNTDNSCRTPSPESKNTQEKASDKALSVATSVLRRSPRFTSSASVAGKEASGLSKKSTEIVIVKNQEGGVVGSGSRKRRRCEVEDNVGSLRRSPRLRVSGSDNRNVNKKQEILALPEPERLLSRKSRLENNVVLSEKSLRSRTVMQVKVEVGKKKVEEGGTLINAVSVSKSVVPIVETEANLIEMPNSGDKVDDALNQKCLRNRKIEFKVVQNESADRMTNAFHSKSKGMVLTSERKSRKKEEKNEICESFFIGEPIPEEEARKRWQWRYELKRQRKKTHGWVLNPNEEDEIILNVDCHYAKANVGGYILDIGDCAYIKGEGRTKHIGRILEFFKTMEGKDYFRVQWFFKAEDTVMKETAKFHDKKRLFYSTLMNDNLLDCIISKVEVVEVPPMLDSKSNIVPSADYYYDMEYCVDYSTFRTLLPDTSLEGQSSTSFTCLDSLCDPLAAAPLNILPSCESLRKELTLLDLYSGCGGMSTGLCLGAKLSGLNLVTRWALDLNKSACDSLRLNHPETQVRNESAEDYLELLKRWEQLCKSHVFDDLESIPSSIPEDPDKNAVPAGEYEVSHLVDICYGDPGESGKRGLHFKVRWKGYGPNDDTWEPVEGLSNCEERIQDFVRSGLKSKILPLPGDVDVICGGPPCQGISGYNRYRNVDAPLADERNQQIVVFMDIVEFLKPKYVLMENVVDIIRFDKGSLGRYALSRLVHMKYQARLGTMASGCYGLPQFRLRVFIWGAIPSEKLPQFPLPTHDVVVRYWPPIEFERNTVAYDEGQPRELEEAVVLSDAISDLPAVANDERRDEMPYGMLPQTEFQKYMRLSKHEIMGSMPSKVEETSSVLYDHRPYCMSENNYLRVCQVPHRKGANFRDLPGVIVGNDNVVRRDTSKDTPLLPSGEPIVPDCAINFEQGKSKRPYARLWWDETVATLVTFPNCRSQAVLHPEQDRVLTIREFARLQGFPDFYRFCGTVKERYCQVGNAVSVPVSRALGYALGTAFRKLSGDEALVVLPPKFSLKRSSNDEIVVLGN